MRILSDSFFKEVMNPEYSGTRLESLLSELLLKKVKIVQILPNDSTRIADEVALLITDIVVIIMMTRFGFWNSFLRILNLKPCIKHCILFV